MTQDEIKQRISYFYNTAAFLAEANENITCLKYLFMAEFYKDFLEA